ncbi:MAG: hypothetical protein WCO25_01595 [Candidatus Uhrbacteria bacterium]
MKITAGTLTVVCAKDGCGHKNVLHDVKDAKTVVCEKCHGTIALPASPVGVITAGNVTIISGNVKDFSFD